jgi:hypothetical protein
LFPVSPQGQADFFYGQLATLRRVLSLLRCVSSAISTVGGVDCRQTKALTDIKQGSQSMMQINAACD